MFESDREPEGGSNTNQPDMRRRVFLTSLGAALGGAVLWSWRKPYTIVAEAKTTPGEVTIVQFSDEGRRLAKVKIAKVVKSEAEWQKQLPSGVFQITRHADTEFAYSGKYWNLHDNGIYRCICCDNALFSSTTKFDSGTGWPSFWEPLAKENGRGIHGSSLGCERGGVAGTEAGCGSGHA